MIHIPTGGSGEWFDYDPVANFFAKFPTINLFDHIESPITAVVDLFLLLLEYAADLGNTLLLSYDGWIRLTR